MLIFDVHRKPRISAIVELFRRVIGLAKVPARSMAILRSIFPAHNLTNFLTLIEMASSALQKPLILWIALVAFSSFYSLVSDWFLDSVLRVKLIRRISPESLLHVDRFDREADRRLNSIRCTSAGPSDTFFPDDVNSPHGKDHAVD